AAMSFFSNAYGAAKVHALEELHKVVLELGGHLERRTYKQYLSEVALGPGDWRPAVMSLMRALRYDREKHGSAKDWHGMAKGLLSPYMALNGRSIGQRIRYVDVLSEILDDRVSSGLPARTIHSVKGQEYPAV